MKKTARFKIKETLQNIFFVNVILQFIIFVILLNFYLILQFGEFTKYGQNRENLVKNRNFVKKSKFCSKIEILVKSRKFGQKSKFC